MTGSAKIAKQVAEKPVPASKQPSVKRKTLWVEIGFGIRLGCTLVERAKAKEDKLSHKKDTNRPSFTAGVCVCVRV